MTSSINNIAAVGAAADPASAASTHSASSDAASTTKQTQAQAQAQAQASSSTPSAPDPADLRLVIEDDQAAGSYVYKTVDWRTGEVVQQYPSEEILRLREASGYQAGSVIKAQA